MHRIRTTISDDIEVQHCLHAKGKNGRCTIYLRFYILEKTVRVHEALLSTGITVSKEKWTSEGTIKGSGYDTQDKKERLRERLAIVRDSLHELKKLRIKNAAIIRQEIEEGLRLKLQRTSQLM